MGGVSIKCIRTFKVNEREDDYDYVPNLFPLKNGEVIYYCNEGMTFLSGKEYKKQYTFSKSMTDFCQLEEEDEALFAAISSNIEIYLKDEKDEYKCYYRLSAHSSYINEIISLSSYRIATCSDDWLIKIWNFYIDNGVKNKLKADQSGVFSAAPHFHHLPKQSPLMNKKV